MHTSSESVTPRGRSRAFLSSILLLALVVSLPGCKSQDDTNFEAIEPQLLAPPHGKELENFPRMVVLSWRKVPAASRYIVEIEMQNPLDGLWMPTPVGLNRRIVKTERLQVNFPGQQAGRWRVVAVNDNGVQSRTSEWWRFEFLR